MNVHYRLRCIPDTTSPPIFEWLVQDRRYFVSLLLVREWIQDLRGKDDYVELGCMQIPADKAQRMQLAEYLELVVEGK